MSMVQSDDTRERLISILTAPTHMSLQLSALDIGDETSLINDLGLDSIQVLEFCTAIEDEFKISIAEISNAFDVESLRGPGCPCARGTDRGRAHTCRQLELGRKNEPAGCDLARPGNARTRCHG